MELERADKVNNLPLVAKVDGRCLGAHTPDHHRLASTQEEEEARAEEAQKEVEEHPK